MFEVWADNVVVGVITRFWATASHDAETQIHTLRAVHNRRMVIHPETRCPKARVAVGPVRSRRCSGPYRPENFQNDRCLCITTGRYITCFFLALAYISPENYSPENYSRGTGKDFPGIGDHRSPDTAASQLSDKTAVFASQAKSTGREEPRWGVQPTFFGSWTEGSDLHLGCQRGKHYCAGGEV